MSRPQKSTRDLHGTNNRYVAGCSCLACCDAHAEYMRENREGRRYVPRMTDASAARRHIRRLSKRIPLAEIARRAGVDRATVRALREGQPKAWPRTIDAVMAVRAPRFKEHDFECRYCGEQVHIADPSDKRTVYCSAQCEKQYWRHVTKKPLNLTEHSAWHLEWRERVGA